MSVNCFSSIWVGTYPTLEIAAAAYDVVALALKGSDTPRNFPEFYLSYSIPVSTSATDTSAAASKQESGSNPEVGRAEVEGSSSHSGTSKVESGQEFIDEEALLNLPNLVVDMAGGMLLSPPRINTPSSDDSPSNSDAEGLWSYQ